MEDITQSCVNQILLKMEIEKANKKPDKKATRVSIPIPKFSEAELKRRREEEQES